jgi:hypothetical protein
MANTRKKVPTREVINQDQPRRNLQIQPEAHQQQEERRTAERRRRPQYPARSEELEDMVRKLEEEDAA